MHTEKYSIRNYVYIYIYRYRYRHIVIIYIWYTRMYANIWLYSLLNAAGCMILFWPAKIARHVGGAPSRMCPPCLGRLTRSPLSVDDFMGFHGISWDFLWGFTNGWRIVERSIRYQKVLNNWIVNLIPFPDVKTLPPSGHHHVNLSNTNSTGFVWVQYQ